jgi:hypothetical protein
MGRISGFDKIVFKPFSMRIENIEATNYTKSGGSIVPMQSHINKNFSFFEIVKWFPNPYFGKSSDYNLVDAENRIWENKDGSSYRLVGDSHFTREESRYMLAHFTNLDHDDFIPELLFCGGRPFELDSVEQNIFFMVTRYCHENIISQLEIEVKKLVLK